MFFLPPLPSTCCGLGRCLGLVAWDAERLKVGVIILAALSDVDDVVNLKVITDVTALLAGVLVTKQDAVTGAAPGPTTSTSTPC